MSLNKWLACIVSQIVWASKKLAKVLEYLQEKLVDKNIRDIITVDVGTFMSFISGRDKETQIIKTKSGKYLKGIIAIKIFNFEGEPYFITFNSFFELLD